MPHWSPSVFWFMQAVLQLYLCCASAQVARALLEDKSTQRDAGSSSASSRVSLTDSISTDKLQTLLRARESGLILQIGQAMAAAAKAAGPDQKSVAAATAQAFDDNLDKVVALGWAHVERLCLDNFINEVSKASAQLRPALAALAALYGATRVEREAAFYLANGVISRDDAAALRTAVNDMCRVLGGQGAAPALRLCEAFGIPDHLLQAPIALNWKGM